ncbi:transposase [Enterococcus thailandicus]|uniref:transposase n=1 Tax=Enterococcus thailandicus TaxID=417368 RepID=UPI003BEEDF2B
MEASGAFAKKWKTSYPKVVESILMIIKFTFYDFLGHTQDIYSTNLIESFNKQIKKYTPQGTAPKRRVDGTFLSLPFDTYNQNS